MDLTKLISETRDALKSINIDNFNYEVIRDNIFVSSDKKNYKILMDRKPDGTTNVVIFNGGEFGWRSNGNLDKVIRDIKNVIM